MSERIPTFREFWPFYVSQHMNAACRWLHFAGSSIGLVLLIAAFATQRFWLIPLGFVQGYAWAWVGHFIIEKNRPATFQYPLWSFMGDWVMWGKILSGKMNEEVAKVARAGVGARASY